MNLEIGRLRKSVGVYVILGVVCVVGEREVELCSIGWPWEGKSMVYDWGETKIVGGVGFLPG